MNEFTYFSFAGDVLNCACLDHFLAAIALNPSHNSSSKGKHIAMDKQIWKQHKSAFLPLSHLVSFIPTFSFSYVLFLFSSTLTCGSKSVMKEIIENQTRMVSVYSPLHYSDVQKNKL